MMTENAPADSPSRKRQRLLDEGDDIFKAIYARFAAYEQEKNDMKTYVDSLTFRIQSLEARLYQSVPVPVTALTHSPARPLSRISEASSPTNVRLADEVMGDPTGAPTQSPPAGAGHGEAKEAEDREHRRSVVISRLREDYNLSNQQQLEADKTAVADLCKFLDTSTNIIATFRMPLERRSPTTRLLKLVTASSKQATEILQKAHLLASPDAPPHLASIYVRPSKADRDEREKAPPAHVKLHAPSRYYPREQQRDAADKEASWRRNRRRDPSAHRLSGAAPPRSHSHSRYRNPSLSRNSNSVRPRNSRSRSQSRQPRSNSRAFAPPLIPGYSAHYSPFVREPVYAPHTSPTPFPFAQYLMPPGQQWHMRGG